MANTKISALTPNTNPSGGEEMVYALNNANGKITLNTMKTFVQNNLTWYATTADLTTWLATKQDTLVSWTNIRTINGASVMWSWDIIVTWWTWYTAWPWIDITWWVISATWWTWGSWFDCTVASDWTWDYTTIDDAITAWEQSIFVKNWTYTMSSWTLSTWNFTMVWEDKNLVVINITYPTRSWTIFTMTSDTTSISNSFLISNITFNISYTWAFGYFSLFWVDTNNQLTVNDCNICLVDFASWWNFYISQWDWTSVFKWCYLSIYPTSWSPASLWLISNSRVTCVWCTLVIDAWSDIASAIRFWDSSMYGTFIECRFEWWVNHNTAWDIALIGWVWTNFLWCRMLSSSSATFRYYWTFDWCAFPVIWANASYDTALATAVSNNAIAPWKANTAYTVWQYISCWWNNNTLYVCKTAHTSWATFASTNWTAVYWDVFIGATIRNAISFTVWWMVLFSWQWQSTWAWFPADAWWASKFTITVKPATWVSSSAIIVPWYKKIDWITIQEWYNYSWWFKVLLCWECAHFSNNTILSSQWSIYSSWKSNMIVNNIWTYVSWWTTPTITQISWGGSTIDNNIIFAAFDWTD